MQGFNDKLAIDLGEDGVARYELNLSGTRLALNKLIGSRVKIKYLGQMQCVSCYKVVSKALGQGFCQDCQQTKAAADRCIMSPEFCHDHLGTCREPAWADTHCKIPFTVYLANSSGLKVGMTRTHQQLVRWLDQGAIQALPILEVPMRLTAGLAEDFLRKFVSDRTDWRKMLKPDVPEINLREERDFLFAKLDEDWRFFKSPDDREVRISYPVKSWPLTLKSFSFGDDLSTIEGELLGIKGQYLLFADGVLNVRKYTGYLLSFEHR